MILTSLKRWFLGTRAKPIRGARFRPEILLLEERLTPANTMTWIGNGVGMGALWSDGGNWSGGVYGDPGVVAEWRPDRK
jgi:hypothetical protein